MKMLTPDQVIGKLESLMWDSKAMVVASNDPLYRFLIPAKMRFVFALKGFMLNFRRDNTVQVTRVPAYSK